VNVDINESGRDDQSLCVESFICLTMQPARRSDLPHPTVFDQQVIFAFKLL
jgi:hypothetical protein